MVPFHYKKISFFLQAFFSCLHLFYILSIFFSYDMITLVMFMRSVGIIAEYNPFHNGHKYHLEKVKKMFPNATILLILSPTFTQRGEVSILNKWEKTEIALENGIDLVVELPFAYACQSADFFAEGSLKLLSELRVDALVFGSESNDLSMLMKNAQIQLENPFYHKKVKEFLNQGVNYPTALSKALQTCNGSFTKSPNDLLGICYLKEILKNHYSITPFCIQRTNDYHTLSSSKITSASSIRTLLKQKKDVSMYLPKETQKYLKDPVFMEDYFSFLKYKILSEDDLSKYQTVDEGLESRIKKAIVESETLEQLIQKVKTKRYTHNKISRMFLHILCDFTKEDAQNKKISYIRILGFSKKGKSYLKDVKKNTTLPIYTKFYQNDPVLAYEFKITKIYSLIFPYEKQKYLIEKEYKNPLIF